MDAGLLVDSVDEMEGAALGKLTFSGKEEAESCAKEEVVGAGGLRSMEELKLFRVTWQREKGRKQTGRQRGPRGGQGHVIRGCHPDWAVGEVDSSRARAGRAGAWNGKEARACGVWVRWRTSVRAECGGW